MFDLFENMMVEKDRGNIFVRKIEKVKRFVFAYIIYLQ